MQHKMTTSEQAVARALRNVLPAVVAAAAGILALVRGSLAAAVCSQGGRSDRSLQPPDSQCSKHTAAIMTRTAWLQARGCIRMAASSARRGARGKQLGPNKAALSRHCATPPPPPTLPGARSGASSPPPVRWTPYLRRSGWRTNWASLW